jgi:hypothetical protein
MLTKLDVRKIIDNTKNEYSTSHDKVLLLKVAITKGLYKALGGTKCVPVPTIFDSITTYSFIIFKYKIKCDTLKSNNKAFNILVKELMENRKSPEYFLGENIPTNNKDIANLLSTIVIYDYEYEDIIINQNNIYSITFDLLQDMDGRKAGA